MKIDIYCVGYSEGVDTAIIGGGGLILVCVDSAGRIQRREFQFWLSMSDQDISSLQTTRLGLASIVPKFRDAKTILHVDSDVVANCLTARRGEFDDRQSELCRWYSYYKDIQVVVHSDLDGELIRAKELAIAGCRTQHNTDSLTMVVNDDK